MKRSITGLTGFALSGTDGLIGIVKGFYFESASWTIRYLVVQTGNWLSGRMILVTPEALLQPAWKQQTFPTDISHNQIKNSPLINLKLPISRQEEIGLYAYYPWAPYYENMDYFDDTELINITGTKNIPDNKNGNDLINQHLRSIEKVLGYNVNAVDGIIGKIVDFIIDVSNWKIQFIVIGKENQPTQKKMLCSPDMVKYFDWSTNTLSIYSTVFQVKHSPYYDFDNSFTDKYKLVI